MIRKAPRNAQGVLLYVGLAACSSQLERVSADSDGGTGGGGATIPAGVQEIFTKRCARAGACHNDTAAIKGLSLTETGAPTIFGRPSVARPDIPLVTMGSVEKSFLAIMILPAARVEALGLTASRRLRMPSGTAITPEIERELALIIGWIEGADVPAADTAGP